jgi:HPt (histidine-containing phosphotransfer) domain-containing protein
MIDWNRVRELQDEIGKAEFSEVVMMFLEEADEVLARITNDNGPKPLGDDCHYLKGAALNLGFQMLAALCQNAEARAKHGDCTADIGEMQHCYRASREALLTGLGKLAA